jgi:hypothetical protein
LIAFRLRSFNVPHHHPRQRRTILCWGELKARGFGAENGSVPLNASAADWLRAFELNKGMQKDAFQAVLDASKAFDAKHGSTVAKTVWNQLWAKKFDRIGWGG